MLKPSNEPRKVLPFTVPHATMEGKLEKWFRGVIQSNRDLITALERLRDSYQELAGKTPTEAEQAVLLAVQITLTNARNAQVL